MKSFEECKILLIDSVLPELTVGVINNGKAEFRHSSHQRNHDKSINALVVSLLSASGIAFSDIDYYAIIAGPGSWTGCRVGVAAVKGFCAAVPRPIAVLNTLDVISYTSPLPAALHSHSDIYFVQDNGKCISEKLKNTNGYITLENITKEQYFNNMVSLVRNAIAVKRVTDARTLVPNYITDFEIKT